MSRFLSSLTGTQHLSKLNAFFSAVHSRGLDSYNSFFTIIEKQGNWKMKNLLDHLLCLLSLSYETCCLIFPMPDFDGFLQKFCQYIFYYSIIQLSQNFFPLCKVHYYQKILRSTILLNFFIGNGLFLNVTSIFNFNILHVAYAVLAHNNCSVLALSLPS